MMCTDKSFITNTGIFH